jgi:predicted amidohydrolase YtcJ
VEIISESGKHVYPGCWVLPGLVDSHCHLYGLGEKISGLRLYDAKSAGECIERAILHNKKRGDWIIGMGWNQELWNNPVFPDASMLDEAFPDTPVYLSRADGHAAWVNSEAMRRCGIHENTPQPEGGAILMNHGRPMGILIDNAMNLVNSFIPGLDDQGKKDRILSAAMECIRMGITEIHDMDVHPILLPLFLEMAESGTLPIRVQSYVRAQNNEWLSYGCLPAIGEFMRITGLKFFADGALGSRGAALLEPYSDAPNTKGLFLINHNDLFEKAKLGLENGWSIATHAIGDAANRMVLDVYQQLRMEGHADEDALLRIEHAQIVHPSDRERFRKYNVIAAVQPVHCISDAATMAMARLGAERSAYAYPWRSLRHYGLGLAGGSDFPIESGNPLLGIDAYCRRIPFNSSEPWFGDEKLTRQEALLSYTLWAHEASGMGYRRGILKPKYDADFTIMNRDIGSCPAEEISNTRIMATYTAGIRRYSAE